MNIGDILKVIGKNAVIGAKVAAPFAGNGILGGVLNAIVAGGAAVTQAGDERKAIALAKLAQTHPNADPAKLSKALDLQIAAMNAMAEAEGH